MKVGKDGKSMLTKASRPIRERRLPRRPACHSRPISKQIENLRRAPRREKGESTLSAQDAARLGSVPSGRLREKYALPDTNFSDHIAP